MGCVIPYQWLWFGNGCQAHISFMVRYPQIFGHIMHNIHIGFCHSVHVFQNDYALNSRKLSMLLCLMWLVECLPCLAVFSRGYSLPNPEMFSFIIIATALCYTFHFIFIKEWFSCWTARITAWLGLKVNKLSLTHFLCQKTFWQTHKKWIHCTWTLMGPDLFCPKIHFFVKTIKSVRIEGGMMAIPVWHTPWPQPSLLYKYPLIPM